MDAGELIAHPYATLTGRWVVAAVLLVAGMSKLVDRRAFVEAIRAFRIVPTGVSRALALCLPWFEVALGAALVIGLWTRVVAATTAVLLAAFSVAIAVNLARGHAPECRCFGPLYRGRISGWSLVRNAVFMACAMWVFQAYDGYLSLEAWLFDWRQPDAPPVEGLLPLVFTALLIGMGVLVVRQVVLSFRVLKVPAARKEWR